MTETKEERKQRLAAAHFQYHLKVYRWAQMLEGLHDLCYPHDEQLMALMVATQVLRNAKPTQVKRAHTEVRQLLTRKGK